MGDRSASRSEKSYLGFSVGFQQFKILTWMSTRVSKLSILNLYAKYTQTVSNCCTAKYFNLTKNQSNPKMCISAYRFLFLSMVPPPKTNKSSRLPLRTLYISICIPSLCTLYLSFCLSRMCGIVEHPTIIIETKTKNQKPKTTARLIVISVVNYL